MFWLQLAFVAVVLWVIFDHWHRKRIHKNVLKIAVVNYPSYPIIGHSLSFLGNDEDRMLAFQDIGQQANKNGGVVGFWFGRRMFLISTDPELNEYILKTFMEKDYLMDFLQEISGNGSIFAPECTSQSGPLKGLCGGMGPTGGPFESLNMIRDTHDGYHPRVHYMLYPEMFPAMFSIWRPRRKMIAPAFSPKILKQFVEVFVEKSDELVNQLRGAADGKPFSVWQYLALYTMDAVCKTNLGMDVSAQQNPQQPFLQAFEKIFKELADRVCQPWLQINWLYKLLPRAHIFNKHSATIDGFIHKVIRQRRTEMKKNMNSTTEADRDHKHLQPKLQTFLNMLMEANDEDSGSLCDKDIRDECVVIALAGTDTSAVSACFTLCMLARHPGVQEKVYDELKEVFGDSKRPLIHDDLTKLRYFDAVLKESLRLYPPVPVIVRKVDKEITLKSGETLVPGMGILIHIWATHRNPKYWGPDVDQFRPERFLEPLQHPVQFLPFSQGPRNCLGYQYAMTSVKTALSNILRNYRVLPDSGSNGLNEKSKPMRVKFDIMMKDVDNFTIQLESR